MLVRLVKKHIFTKYGRKVAASAVSFRPAVRGGGLICHETGDPVEDETAGVLVGVHSLLNNKLVTLHTRVAMFNKWIEDGCGVATALEILVASLFLITLILN
ncbi:hypothetical protein EVAR_34246_1 [Eumeta japonica]|uniref:Uncharacterized protein n=1 Tax=Eumeta variegata TaxID=151549 RepID=A0A4C1S8M8_EUMVA|nr:hypothetical protein EVAR_34246_1 [Eumeta japonica]